ANGRSQAEGLAGAAGAPNGSPCGGQPGLRSTTVGMGCADGSPQNGGNGGEGCPGSIGGHGMGGDGTGVVSPGGWSASNGTSGSVAGRGGGGGGGGAGAGESCTGPFDVCVFCGTGRGG